MSDHDFAKVTKTDHADAARTILAQLRARGDEGDDDGAEPFDGCEVVQPMGLTARPKITSTTEALIFRDGDEAIVIALIDKGIATKTGDSPAIEEGETRLHGACADNVTSYVRIKADKSIEIVGAANANITVLPQGSGKVYIGDTSSGSAQPAVLGNDLNSYLDGFRQEMNKLRADVNTIKTHTHTTACTAGGASVPLSSDLTSLPTASTVNAPPALAANVLVK